VIQLLNWRYIRQHGEVTVIAYRMESELSLAVSSLVHSMVWRPDDMVAVLSKWAELTYQWSESQSGRAFE
jgi:hypothetical protein